MMPHTPGSDTGRHSGEPRLEAGDIHDPLIADSAELDLASSQSLLDEAVLEVGQKNVLDQADTLKKRRA